MPEDKSYEVTIVQDVKVQSGYAIMQINGYNSTQDQDLYRVVNLSSKKKFTIPVKWNTNSQFIIEGKELVVTTDSQMGHPLGIDTSAQHVIYARYDLTTGATNLSIKRSFTSIESNWSSSYLNRQVIVIDSEQNKISVMDHKGNVLKDLSLAVSLRELGGKLVVYYNENFYMLALDNGGNLELIEVPIQETLLRN
ncbi:hypothetical protein D3C81_1670020 [compost metagenome]